MIAGVCLAAFEAFETGRFALENFGIIVNLIGSVHRSLLSNSHRLDGPVCPNLIQSRLSKLQLWETSFGFGTRTNTTYYRTGCVKVHRYRTARICRIRVWQM